MTPERQTEIHNVRTCDFPQTLEEQKNLQRLVDNGVFTVTYGLISQGKVDDDVRVSLGDNFLSSALPVSWALTRCTARMLMLSSAKVFGANGFRVIQISAPAELSPVKSWP